MSSLETPWHYIRPNEASRYPRRIITFDTESVIQETKQGERHTFRLACASFDEIDRESKQPFRSEREDFDNASDLWAWLGGKAIRKGRTVVFAHNLAYDLRIGDGFTHLPATGWTLDFLTLDTARCVCRWSRDGRSLTFTDTTSWFPCSLERVGAALGIGKAPLPNQGDDRDTWLDRCRRDVDITRAAVLHLLRYLETADMGSFRLTGPAQAMAAYRHRFMPRAQLLVHRDVDALAAERRAAWTGRCELYRHGRTNGGVEEWDYELAYLRVARDAQLPVRLRGVVNKLSWKQLLQYRGRYAILADVTVTTDQPVLPTKVDDRTVWPVGVFRSTAWDCELVAAADRGATITVERAWLYVRAPVLREWSLWLLDRLTNQGLDDGPLIQLLHKHWARALIGRFGLRYPLLDKVATLDTCGIEYHPFVDADDGSEGAYLQVGADMLEKAGLAEARDSMPAVMSAIMAASRVRLLEAVEAAGEANVLYVDTDALLVTHTGGRRLRAWAKTPAGEGLRRKASYTAAVLRAPRSISLDDEARVAGMPKSAVAVGDNRYHAEVWEGLGESLRHRRPGEVRISRRVYTLKAPDRRRRHLAGGATAPIVVELP